MTYAQDVRYFFFPNQAEAGKRFIDALFVLYDEGVILVDKACTTSDGFHERELWFDIGGARAFITYRSCEGWHSRLSIGLQSLDSISNYWNSRDLLEQKGFTLNEPPTICYQGQSYHKNSRNPHNSSA